MICCYNRVKIRFQIYNTLEFVSIPSEWETQIGACLEYVNRSDDNRDCKDSGAGNFEANKKVARRGGRIAGNARLEIEADTGKPVITSKNAAQLNTLLTDMIEGVRACAFRCKLFMSPAIFSLHFLQSICNNKERLVSDWRNQKCVQRLP